MRPDCVRGVPKLHWNTITLDGSLPDRLVRDQLGWAPGTEVAASVKRPSDLSD